MTYKSDKKTDMDLVSTVNVLPHSVAFIYLIKNIIYLLTYFYFMNLFFLFFWSESMYM